MEENQNYETQSANATYARKKKNDELIEDLCKIFEEENNLIEKNPSSMYYRNKMTKLIRKVIKELKAKRINAIEISKK